MSLLSHIPAGAVPSGSFMTFTLRPLRAEGFSAAQLTLAFEQAENRLVTHGRGWTATGTASPLKFSSRRTIAGWYGALLC